MKRITGIINCESANANYETPKSFVKVEKIGRWISIWKDTQTDTEYVFWDRGYGCAIQKLDRGSK